VVIVGHACMTVGPRECGAHEVAAIVELGNGQVAKLPEGTNVCAFYTRPARGAGWRGWPPCPGPDGRMILERTGELLADAHAGRRWPSSWPCRLPSIRASLDSLHIRCTWVARQRDPR
jgi:hypothetical protein